MKEIERKSKHALKLSFKLNLEKEITWLKISFIAIIHVEKGAERILKYIKVWNVTSSI